MGRKPDTDDLKASGCTKEQIRQFRNCSCAEEELKFLKDHRKCLLDKIHEQEQQISTLDYLTHQIEKDKGGNTPE